MQKGKEKSWPRGDTATGRARVLVKDTLRICAARTEGQRTAVLHALTGSYSWPRELLCRWENTQDRAARAPGTLVLPTSTGGSM